MFLFWLRVFIEFNTWEAYKGAHYREWRESEWMICNNTKNTAVKIQCDWNTNLEASKDVSAIV